MDKMNPLVNIPQTGAELGVEAFKTQVILKEMLDAGVITDREAIAKAMEEGMNVAQCVRKEQPYKCTITY